MNIAFCDQGDSKHREYIEEMAVNTTVPLAILGAGAWGLSTALHLLNAGYINIAVFDQASEIPSPYSAGYDLNKIVRAEYEDEFYMELALVSWQASVVISGTF